MKNDDPSYPHERRFLPLFSAHQICKGLDLTDVDARRLMDEIETIDSEGNACEGADQFTRDQLNSQAVSRLVDPEAAAGYAFGRSVGTDALAKAFPEY